MVLLVVLRIANGVFGILKFVIIVVVEVVVLEGAEGVWLADGLESILEGLLGLCVDGVAIELEVGELGLVAEGVGELEEGIILGLGKAEVEVFLNQRGLCFNKQNKIKKS